MKFLSVCDIHIFHWFKNSVVDERGIPSRLSQYETLASDLEEYADTHGIDAYLLEGDLLQTPTSPPMVLNVAKQFLITLSRKRPCFVIPGNHDVDAKGDNNSFHSVIAPLVDQDTPNLVYVAEETVYDFHGVKLFFRPWVTGDANFENLKPADIALLHGPIVGCRDTLGYEFKSGFRLDDLFANYRAAFVGDIHNPQVFNDTRTGNVAVIPGALIGNRFSDNLGHFCVYDADAHTVESVCIRELKHGSRYYYFRNNSHPDADELKQYPNTLYKAPKEGKRAANKAGSATPAPKTTVIDAIYNYLSQLPIEHKPEIRDVISGIYEKVKVEYALPAPNRVAYRSLTAENFLSIQDPVTFEFPKEEDEILIRGTNGSGKSTFPEALYWAVTGELSKDLPVALINNDYGKSTARVTLDFDIDADKYRVTRTRESGNLLKLEKNGSNISKASAAETQQLIYEILGFGKEEIDLMVYFSLNTENLFTSLGVNQQLEFISKLAQAEILDEIRVKFKEKISELNNEILVNATNASQIGNQVERVTAKILGLQQERDRVQAAAPATTPAESLSDLQGKLSVLNRNRDGFVAERDRWNARVTELKEARVALDRLALQDQTVANKMKDTKASLTAMLERRKAAASGKCYACGHELVDAQQLTQIDADIKALSQKAKDLAVYKQQAPETLYLDNEHETDMAKAEAEKVNRGLVEIDLLVSGIQDKIRAHEKAKPAPARDYDGEIAVLERERDEMQAELTKYGVEKLESRKASYTAAAKLLDKTNKNPVYTSSINSAYEQLLTVANSHLQAVGFSVSFSKSYELMVKVDGGKERPVKALSGGEKRLIDVIMLLSLSRCYQEMYHLDYPLFGMTIYDEVFVYLSPQNMQFAHGLIADMPGIKICISNDEGLLGLFSNVIMVSKDPRSGSKYSFSYN